MYYISFRENSPLTEKHVKHLKPITFKELPGITFVIFQEKDTKYWNITEVETGIKVIEKPIKEDVISFIPQNAERIITALDNLKKNPMIGFKKIPLVNQEPQPTGAKLCKVLTYNGIKKHFLIEYKTIQGITFYAYLNDTQPYDYIFVECNGHFVNIGTITQVENIANRIIIENLDIHEMIVEAFNKSLQSDNNCFLGYAEYLGRTEEALTHNKKMYNKQVEKEKQREEEKKRKEEEQKQREQQAITEAGNKFINGEKISGNMFVSLCDEYGIKLPLRTRGWCLKSLVSIDQNTYNYNGNTSTVIWDYAGELKEKISA